jgi:N utilization substance protein B
LSGPRHRAREAALQILYFWEVGRTDPEAAAETFFEQHEPDAEEPVRAFADRLVGGTIADLDELDRTIERHSQHWRLERMAVLDRLILRLAIWELRHPDDVPPPVIVNEALELARRFSTEDAVRFINGVLDAVIKRPDEPSVAQP